MAYNLFISLVKLTNIYRILVDRIRFVAFLLKRLFGVKFLSSNHAFNCVSFQIQVFNRTLDGCKIPAAYMSIDLGGPGAFMT
jgi:hypothetical protein